MIMMTESLLCVCLMIADWRFGLFVCVIHKLHELSTKHSRAEGTTVSPVNDFGVQSFTVVHLTATSRKRSVALCTVYLGSFTKDESTSRVWTQ